MPHLTRVLALLATVVITAAATVFAAGAIGGGDERALPTIGDPIPVIEPVSAVDEGAALAGSDDSGSTSGGGGPSLEDLSDVASAESLSEPAVDGATDEESAGVPHFVDPCAGVEPGDAADACDGAAGTILEGEPRAIVAPFKIVSARSYSAPGVPTLRRGCVRLADLHPSAYDLRLVIESNNPADFTFQWGDPAAPSSGRVSTPDSERALWDEWEAAGTTGAAFGNLVQTCVLFRNVAAPAGESWPLVIVGNDGLTEDRVEIGFSGGTSVRTGRPPVEIRAHGPSHVAIVVPMLYVRGGGIGARRMDDRVEVRVTDLTTGSCAAFESHLASGGGGGRTLLRDEQYREASDAEVEALVPETQGWVNSYSVGIGPFDEGTTSRLCIWWLDANGRVNEREQHDIAAPSSYRLRARLTAVDFERSVTDGTEPISFSLRQPGASFNSCVTTYEGAIDGGRHALTPPQPTCDATDNGAPLGRTVELQVRGPYGRTDSVRIPVLTCASSGCAPLVTQGYRVTIPGRREIVGLCGGMGSCDPPSADVAIGRAAFRVDFVDGPSGAGPTWAFGAGEAFSASVESAGTAAGRPYLVEAHIEGVSEGDTQLDRVLDVSVTTSVGSSVRAFVYDPAALPGHPYEGIPAPCLRGETGEATENGNLGATDETLRLRITGLCVGWTYLIGFELTDLESGARSFYGKRPADAPAGDVIGAPLWTTTPGVRLSLRAELTVLSLPTAGDAHIQDLRGQIGAGNFEWSELHRSGRCAEIRARVDEMWTVVVVVSVGVDVPITVHAYLPGADSSCGGPFVSDFTLRGTVSLDALLGFDAGVTIESPSDDAARFRLTLTRLA